MPSVMRRSSDDPLPFNARQAREVLAHSHLLDLTASQRIHFTRHLTGPSESLWFAIRWPGPEASQEAGGAARWMSRPAFRTTPYRSEAGSKCRFLLGRKRRYLVVSSKPGS